MLKFEESIGSDDVIGSCLPKLIGSIFDSSCLSEIGDSVVSVKSQFSKVIDFDADIE